MQVNNRKVTFEWVEVKDLLPESLRNYWRDLFELIGPNNCYECRIGDDIVAVVTTDNDIKVRVTLNSPHNPNTLSGLVAACERVLQNATQSGAFSDLETTLKVLQILQPYLERIVRQQVERQVYELKQQLKWLESKL